MLFCDFVFLFERKKIAIDGCNVFVTVIDTRGQGNKTQGCESGLDERCHKLEEEAWKYGEVVNARERVVSDSYLYGQRYVVKLGLIQLEFQCD